MPELQFIEKSKIPDEHSLSETLGKTYQYWIELRKKIKEEYPDVNEEWKHYGNKTGWLLKILHKKINLFFFVPCDNYFYLSFVFGDKAVAEIIKSKVPEEMKSELMNARKYAEGRGLRVQVKDKKSIEHILILLKIKVSVR